MTQLVAWVALYKEGHWIDINNKSNEFPPPSISLSPEECVETGTNVTIQCWNKDYGAAFLLHKDGCSAPIQRQDLDVVGTATFTIIGVTPADSGTYRCSYHPWGHPFLSSHLGSNVTLEVTPTPRHPNTRTPQVLRSSPVPIWCWHC
uniref:Ig-like domain-containing protein n=1 Tax=Phasianus colchicus TaxID=9054 RepID=A0A669QHV8_PHACC